MGWSTCNDDSKIRGRISIISCCCGDDGVGRSDCHGYDVGDTHNVFYFQTAKTLISPYLMAHSLWQSQELVSFSSLTY